MPINQALPIVTGCLRPTLVNNLSTLAGIQPSGLRCTGATACLSGRVMKPNHLLTNDSLQHLDLKSRHLFVPAAGVQHHYLELFQTPQTHPKHRFFPHLDAPAQTGVGKAQPPLNWCRVLPPINAWLLMRLASVVSETNSRLYYLGLSDLLGTKQDARSDSSG